MSIDPNISLFSPLMQSGEIITQKPIIAPQAGNPTDSFQSALSQAVGKVNQLQLAASEQQQAINTGQSDDLAGAMVASQQANISFSALLQVRNKLSSALDDILSTPL
ncbi:flagellar hook-basal body complex protein FliE [Rosenbergiella sp. S61]|uniref:Flagellar hook-basal body complex protein FliE n=1 Tax=Rosenbergiella gaditana TaxID=2726987 RepID=A0ABS5T0F0_9GAMM|nr:flagellar hook-basal body complex protein FliE [Rosenbergiella gaditana]MBT0725223.1 flagellar hook-basal body complex protein FliE [Rosenbergiella gaditana]